MPFCHRPLPNGPCEPLSPARLRPNPGAFRVTRGLTRGAFVGLTVAALGLSFALPAGAASDTSAPSVPGSVSTAYYGGVGTVVNWGKVSASDLANYVVYRSTSKTIDPAKNAIATPTTLTYTDAAAPTGSTVYYAIAAKDKTGNVSKPSSVQTVKTTDTTAPSMPVIVEFSISWWDTAPAVGTSAQTVRSLPTNAVSDSRILSPYR